MRISEEINCSTTEHYLSLDKNEMGIVLHARFPILSDRTNLGAMPKSRLLRCVWCAARYCYQLTLYLSRSCTKEKERTWRI